MKTVLNIQAHEQVAKLMRWILVQSGFNVIDARDEPNPATAMAAPNVIIMNTNVNLAEKRAYVAALRLIAPHAAILDLSDDAETSGYNTGANQYLSKPFSGEDLVARVRAAIADGDPMI